MFYRFGSSGPPAFIGCGAFIILFGLVLLTPVGVFLVKAIGWVSVVIGVAIAAAGIFYWLTGSNRRYL